MEGPAEMLLMPRRCPVDSSVSARPSRGQSGVSGGVGWDKHHISITLLFLVKPDPPSIIRSVRMLTVVDDLIVPLPSDRVHGAIHE